MSISKRRMEHEQDLYDLGLQLCIEVGAIEECPYHPGTYYDGGGDVQDAYKLANAQISRGEIDLGDDENRKTITDAVLGAYEDNCGVSSCMSCQRMLEQD